MYPAYKTYQEVLWLLFIVSLLVRMYSGFLAFGALLLGLMRRHGFPQFNQQYLQRIAFDDNFHMLTYLSTLATSNGSMILYIPLVLTAYLEIAPKGLQLCQSNISIPFKAYLTDLFSKGTNHKAQFIEMRSDMQV